MSNDLEFSFAKNHLQSRNSASAVFQPLSDSIQVLEMLPHESPDSWVFWYGFVRSILVLIHRTRSPDRYIINIRYGYMRNFLSQDICDIVMEDWDRICPTLR